MSSILYKSKREFLSDKEVEAIERRIEEKQNEYYNLSMDLNSAYDPGRRPGSSDLSESIKKINANCSLILKR